MCGYGEPAVFAARPDVCVSARTRAAVGFNASSSGVDDREISHETDVDVAALEIREFCRQRRQLQKAFPIDKLCVGKGTQKIVRKDLIEPLHVRSLYGPDIVLVQRMQSVNVSRRVH